jgi:hypothetical protein
MDRLIPTNPRNVDLERPYIYFIRVRSDRNEYRYVGKGSKPSRMDAYARNVGRVLAGEPKRPAFKRDGTRQSEGNVKFRYVHLVLAAAIQRGWEIEFVALENCGAHEHTTIERLRKRELDCNMNDGPTWFVEDFATLAEKLE